jgi:hypothetical protein
MDETKKLLMERDGVGVVVGETVFVAQQRKSPK